MRANKLILSLLALGSFVSLFYPMKCTRRERDENVQEVASGGLFLSEAECALTWLSKQRTSNGEIKSAGVKTRAEQLPTLAV